MAGIPKFGNSIERRGYSGGDPSLHHRMWVCGGVVRLRCGLKNAKSLYKINKKTLAVFITHAQGFNGLNIELLKILKRKNIHLIEDVCESHGAIFKNKKLGTFGKISNFSFYYAHHMSTIEGGMI